MDDWIYALTIHQPWIQLILDGLKRLETRCWSTPYRGRIALHAGKATVPLARYGTDPEVVRYFYGTARHLPRGQILAFADLIDVVPTGEAPWDDSPYPLIERQVGDFSSGRYAFVLENIERVGPYDATGNRKLWRWDARTHAAPPQEPPRSGVA